MMIGISGETGNGVNEGVGLTGLGVALRTLGVVVGFKTGLGEAEMDGLGVKPAKGAGGVIAGKNNKTADSTTLMIKTVILEKMAIEFSD